MSVPQIFNRRHVRQHRDRAAWRFEESDFLLREMAQRLAERLDDITRRFPTVLDVGAHNGLLAEYLAGKGGIGALVQTELSHALLRSGNSAGIKLVADEEWLPFAPESFDAVLSAGSLHWINDLPGTLIQIHRILKPDGLFLAILPGGETLKELRLAFEHAEMEQYGGISPRISPFVDVRDAGSLLQRAGFALPVVDSETLTASYAHPLKLMHDLRNMGEANAMTQRRKALTACSTLMLAADNYLRQYSDAQGRIPATFELVTLTGWKPHASQPKPARRGSGQMNLKEALGE